MAADTDADPYAEKPLPRGPLAEELVDDWEHYASIVSKHSEKLIREGGPDPAKWPPLTNKNGSLVVIGSGIKCVSQFTVEALGHIKEADEVFYHVADPVTENYIKKLNPHSRNMAVLYNNKKERIMTYYQMAEVMLYPIRHGKKVVTIYYGHPGIFVFASHRAIKIAHKQGLKAKMLPAVSALDCLFADLGVDPSFPGMQVLEATDFLIRNRQVLTDEHLVLFQVGCVGDRSYRRKGYLMHNFHFLVERLQLLYGREYKITNYIASQYPTVKPTIEMIPLSALENQDFVKKHIAAVSTFYIPPSTIRPTDPEMARKLGLESVVKPVAVKDAPPNKPNTGRAKAREISKYGPREQNSLKMLSEWKVPGAYDSTAPTAAAYFMAALAQEPKKLADFKDNPRKVLKNEKGILPWQAAYLSSGNRAMVRLAVKPNTSTAARAAAVELLTNNSFCKAYKDEMKKYYHSLDFEKQLTESLELHGFKTTPEEVDSALEELRTSSLLPWRQVYHTSDGVLDIRCKDANEKGTVIWKDAAIQNFTFTESTLSWTEGDVNQSSAVLNFTLQNGMPLFTGKLWNKNDSEPSSNNITGTTENFKSPLSIWRGNYSSRTLVKASKTKPGPEVSISFSDSNKAGEVAVGGKTVSKFNFSTSKTLTWEYGEITFFETKSTASVPTVQKFYGYIWEEGGKKPSNHNFWGTKDSTYLQPWSGQYKTYVGPDGKSKYGDELIINGGLTLASSTVKYGDKNIEKFQFNNPVLSWQDDNENVEIEFEVFTNKKLGFKGKKWSVGDSEPSDINFQGVFDSLYLDAWLGSYYTKKSTGPKKTVEGQPFSIVKQSDQYLITCDGEMIKDYNYDTNKRQLSWATSRSNGSLQFYIPPAEKGTGLKFFGKVWPKDSSTPDATNYWGSSLPFPGGSSSGSSSEEKELADLVKNLITIAVIEAIKYAWKKFKKWWKSRKDGSSKEEQQKNKEESDEADDKVDEKENDLEDQEAKTDQLDPEVDPSPEPPTPPEPAPEPPANVTDTDTTDTDTTDTDTTDTDTTDTDTTDTETTEIDTDTDVDVVVDTDVDIVVVDVCSLM